jgi:hypothetical protein
MNPFDFINAINDTKKNLFEDPQAEKEYIPFIVNKALSNFHDTLFYANEMNSRTHLSKKMQFDFLRYSIVSKKRFSKWNKKKTITEDITAICDYYKYSKAKAFEVLSILTKEQIEFIKQEMYKGGKS